MPIMNGNKHDTEAADESGAGSRAPFIVRCFCDGVLSHGCFAVFFDGVFDLVSDSW